MQAKLSVPETLADSISAFVGAQSIPLTVVTGDDAIVRVVQAREGQESSVSTLQAGGWITCGVARELAEKLGIELHQAGKLLNHLEIKIRACALGCF